MSSRILSLIIPAILYRGETWSLTLKGEKKKRLFGRKYTEKYLAQTETKTIEWRKLYNVELKNFFRNEDIIRKLKSRRLHRQEIGE